MFDSLVNSIESWGRKHELSRLDFNRLVEKAALENDVNPAAYKKRVLFQSMIGCLFIFAVVALILGCTGSMLVYMIHSHHHSYGSSKLMLLLLITSAVLLYSLWVRNPPPQGVKLERKECPELFKLVDEISERLKVQIDEVLLDDQMNAYVCQIPRLGVLGWPKNYLVLGYPLMASRSLIMFKATLAHEFGHISGNHGKLSAWIYTVNVMYSQLLDNLRQGSPLLYCVFFAFFHWYAPRFAAYSFVLRRQHEYEADRMAIELTSAEAECLDLISLSLFSRNLGENFWAGLAKTTESREEAPDDLMEQMTDFIKTPIDLEKARKWYQEYLQYKTETSDTHPSLMDRLLFAGYPAKSREEIFAAEIPFEEILNPKMTAGQELFAEKEADYKKLLSQIWQESSRLGWQIAHRQTVENRKVLIDLEEKKSRSELEKDELPVLASLYLSLEGKEKAMPLVRELLEEQPNNAWASLLVGSEMIGRGDDSGVAYIERAMNHDVSQIPDACSYLVAYYKRSGRYDEAEKYLLRLDSFGQEADEAEAERMQLPDNTEFEAHGQDEKTVQKVREVLLEIKELKSAYLARRKVRYLADIPSYVLGIQLKMGFDLSGDRDIKLLDKIANSVEFPFDLRIILIKDKIARKMAAIDGACLLSGGSR